MKKPLILTDSEFEAKFRNSSLPVESFNHEAHLRLTYIHINKYGTEKAIENISTQLLNFIRKNNAESKFNATLTIAAVKTVDHFLQKTKTKNFQEFIKENPQLKTDFRALIDQHYSFDIFTNEKARQEFKEPDLLPYD